MIAAVTTTFNEQDIVEATVRNLLNQGVDIILAADSSTDDTPEILERLGVGVTRLDEAVHRQPYWMTRLAFEAHECGAEWIVPFDADEFWFGLEQLPALAEDVAVAQLWHYRDPNFRYVPAERLPKVAFRYQPGAVIANGNHDVSVPGPRAHVLEICHYQFRSFDHFKRKVHERSRTLDPHARARGDGSHMTRFEHANEDELLAAWNLHIAQEVCFAPIYGYHRLGPRAA